MEGFTLEGFPSFDLGAAPASEDAYSYLARRVKIEQLTYILGEEDPKDVVMRRLGNALDCFPHLYGPRVLVATAPTPVKKSSILLTQTQRDKDVAEGRWQGKCGIILKLGVSAFETDPRYPSYEWKGPKPIVGDFVYYRTSDAWETGIQVSDGISISARIIYDSDIMGQVTSLEAVY